MPEITYRLNDGSSRKINATTGDTVMKVAVDNDVDGIVGRCGGFCNCGTCHVYVDEKWTALLPEQSPEEIMMLDGVTAKRLQSSRLGCQIELTQALDGIVVWIPECQE